MATQTQSLRSTSGVAFAGVVVALDDRPSDRRALLTAVGLALHLDLGLDLIAEHRPKGTGAQYSARRILVDDARRAVVTTHPDFAPRVDTRVVVADRAACAVCEAYPSSIVVMGTDRIASRSDRVARCAAEGLACQARHHPVLVVGPGVMDGWQPGPVAVALDGSSLAESALPAAVAWATALRVHLEIVQVVPPRTNALSNEAVCSPYLRAVERRVESQDVRAEGRTYVSDDTAGTIVHHLRERGCALVCMATHLRGSERDSFGSVTLGVVAQSPCPVRVAQPHAVLEPILAV